MREVTHRDAAVFRLDGDAEQSKLAELRPQRARKRIGAIDLGGERRNFLLRERPRRFAQHLDRFTETEIECGSGCDMRG